MLFKCSDRDGKFLGIYQASKPTQAANLAAREAGFDDVLSFAADRGPVTVARVDAGQLDLVTTVGEPVLVPAPKDP